MVDQHQNMILKVVAQKRTIGPGMKSGSKLSRLTKAAHRIAVSNNLKVQVATDSSTNSQSNSQPIPKNKQVYIVPDVNIRRALACFEAWEKLYPGSGTDGYIQKEIEFSQAQSAVYSMLGINQTKDKAPMLTQAQKQVYDQTMLAHRFTYYEVRLSFTQPGLNAVRSKTYRYLQLPPLENIANKVMSTAGGWLSKVVITTRPVDVQDPNTDQDLNDEDIDLFQSR